MGTKKTGFPFEDSEEKHAPMEWEFLKSQIKRLKLHVLSKGHTPKIVKSLEGNCVLYVKGIVTCADL